MQDITALLEKVEKYDSRIIQSLISILEPHIVEKDGCILISTKSIASFDLSIFHDRTEAEATVNHFHFDGSKLSKYISIIARNWISVLQTNFSNKDFLFYIEHGDILRFHQVRSTEPPWHDIENMRYLNKEKITVIYVRGQREQIGETAPSELHRRTKI